MIQTDGKIQSKSPGSNETVRHYNEDPLFYASFLDPYMKYTSGLFDEKATTLDAACLNMLDAIIEKSEVPFGGSLLEIGPGWGSLLNRLCQVRPDVAFSGISPSQVQNDYIRSQFKKNAQLLTGTFESTDFGDSKFDAIVLIGSFCHLKEKAEVLKKLRGLLKANGRIVIEDSFFLSRVMYDKHANHPATQFVQQDIFGFAEIPPLSSMIDMIAAADLRLMTTLEHSDSYRQTIAEWQKKIQMLPKTMLGERYLAYMAVFQRGWDYTITNHLMVIRPAWSRKASHKAL